MAFKPPTKASLQSFLQICIIPVKLAKAGHSIG